jgi:hypothetical protein
MSGLGYHAIGEALAISSSRARQLAIAHRESTSRTSLRAAGVDMTWIEAAWRRSRAVRLALSMEYG